MDRTMDMAFIRETGNNLILEMNILELKLREALAYSLHDLNTFGEESEKAAEKKYELLSGIKEMIETVNPDYVHFMEFLHFPQGRSNWEFPFDDAFREVDINMDCQVIDHFFDANVRRVYEDVKSCRKNALTAFHSTMDGRVYYKCPCCKSAYFEKNGDYNICPVCNWENDKTQNADPEYRGGANSLCLNEAIVQYRKQFLNE